MSLALIKEVCPNTNYIRHINRGNYAYANFSGSENDSSTMLLEALNLVPFFFLPKTKST